VSLDDLGRLDLSGTYGTADLRRAQLPQLDVSAG
jgi:hypothetical protein